MQPIEYAVIAAAGLGSRLGHGLPKCMLEINGRTLLSRLVETLQTQVKRIHVVVGYREDLVISLCASLHREVVIVRNVDFRTTNTVQSMALGARGCKGKTLFLDGDLIIDPSSLHAFTFAASHHELLVGIAPSLSENPVNVVLQPDTRVPVIDSFTRDGTLPYEWANVLSGPADALDNATGYVYEVLSRLTPLPAKELILREVDTAADLERARAFVCAMDESARAAT